MGKRKDLSTKRICAACHGKILLGSMQCCTKSGFLASWKTWSFFTVYIPPFILCLLSIFLFLFYLIKAVILLSHLLLCLIGIHKNPALFVSCPHLHPVQKNGKGESGYLLFSELPVGLFVTQNDLECGLSWNNFIFKSWSSVMCSVCMGSSGCWVSQDQVILESIEDHAMLTVVLQRYVTKPGAIAHILSVRRGTKSVQAFLLQLSFFTQER